LAHLHLFSNDWLQVKDDEAKQAAFLKEKKQIKQKREAVGDH
jgi:hypothetical protein